MKQYRRTRTEASKDGVKAAKAIIKNKELRVIHPLIKGCDPKRCEASIIQKADFIQQLQTFRPSQTVFETGIGTSTHQAVKNIKDSVGANAMRAFRKQVRSALERTKVKATIYDHLDALEGEEEDVETVQPLRDEYDDEDEEHGNDDMMAENEEVEVQEQKPRISRALKKKLKRNGMPIVKKAAPLAMQHEGVEFTTSTSSEAQLDGSKRSLTSSSFQDPRFYMTYGTEDEKATFSEASLQPKSNLKDRESQSNIMPLI